MRQGTAQRMRRMRHAKPQPLLAQRLAVVERAALCDAGDIACDAEPQRARSPPAARRMS